MSAGVRITKEGLKYFKWDPDVRGYVEEETESFLPRLRNNCIIELGVTLGDIFDAVEKHPDLKSFISMYSRCHVDEFHKEAKRPPLHKADDLKYLELSRHFQYDEGQYDHFNGIGKPNEYGHDSYAIEFTPVNEMVHLEVRLNTKCSVQKDHTEVETTETHYSLLEVLDGIYFEISFVGSPAERDRQGAELKETMKEIENGTAKTVPWEDIRPKDAIQ